MLLFKQLILLKMIKENELRLNNLVMVNYKTDLLSKVTWIQEGSINVIFDRQPDLINGVVCSVNDLIPIPLTEEWLLKAGFLYYKECDLYILEGVEIAGYLQESMSIYIFGSVDSIKIQYIHQLQNLFFSLVGEELVFSTEP